MTANGTDAALTFDHLGGGLVAKGGTLLGLEAAGPAGKCAPARGTFEVDRVVVVRADGVPSPQRVRYAWANDPKCTLFNKAGLPAAPFEANATE